MDPPLPSYLHRLFVSRQYGHRGWTDVPNANDTSADFGLYELSYTAMALQL